MDINTVRSLVTVLSFAVFLGIVFWAWSAKRKPAFDEAANLPFADDDVPVRQIETGARP
jgi:cytochrome c oxidase cbb3-type subunit 4